MKKLQLLLAGIILAFTCATKAQVLTGSISAWCDGSQANSSPMSLFATNFITAATGDFAGIVPNNSLLTPYVGTISGLSTTPLAVSINNYFVFSSTGVEGLVQGTTPINRFEFNLATITEESYNPTTGAATFTGTGTLVDSTGAFSSSPANFTVDFTTANFYTLSLETVPEPATLSLAAAGLLGALVLRRRKV